MSENEAKWAKMTKMAKNDKIGAFFPQLKMHKMEKTQKSEKSHFFEGQKWPKYGLFVKNGKISNVIFQEKSKNKCVKNLFFKKYKKFQKIFCVF